jgi:hypothetical protein
MAKKAKPKVAGVKKTASSSRMKPATDAKASQKAAAPRKTSTGSIAAWEDDPLSGGKPVSMPRPNLAASAFPVRISTPAPSAKVYKVGTSQFRYWAAAEALARAAGMWAKLAPSTHWQPGGVLPVVLDFGVDLNA